MCVYQHQAKTGTSSPRDKTKWFGTMHLFFLQLYFWLLVNNFLILGWFLPSFSTNLAKHHAPVPTRQNGDLFVEYVSQQVYFSPQIAVSNRPFCCSELFLHLSLLCVDKLVKWTSTTFNTVGQITLLSHQLLGNKLKKTGIFLGQIYVVMLAKIQFVVLK